MGQTYARLVEVSRGGIVECVHEGAIAVVDARGRVRYALGDPGLVTYPRSALKPFQALPLVDSGAFDALGWGAEELALACASHAGEPIHVARVSAMLAAIGCTPADLQCGPPQPPALPAWLAEAAAAAAPSPAHHNCSGKHTGFLALCRHRGWPIADYLDPVHPAQVEVRAAIAGAVGVPAAGLAAAIDGCSAPAYAMPLAALARGYARLARAGGDGGAEHPALARIHAAMTAHPQLVGGAGRADTALMAASPGRILAKGGADGVQALALRELGIGVAIKIADGNALAAQVAAVAVLEALGALPEGFEVALAAWRAPAVRNARGTVTGAVRAVFDLKAVG